MLIYSDKLIAKLNNNRWDIDEIDNHFKTHALIIDDCDDTFLYGRLNNRKCKIDACGNITYLGE